MLPSFASCQKTPTVQFHREPVSVDCQRTSAISLSWVFVILFGVWVPVRLAGR